MGAIPSQIAMSDQYGLKPVFGCEMYINPLQPKVEMRSESAAFRKGLPEDQQKIFDKSFHLLGLAYNFTGYQNLVRLTSWAWIHGFYKKPRINHEILQQHKEGIIFTSTCGNSEIAQAFLRNKDDQEEERRTVWTGSCKGQGKVLQPGQRPRQHRKEWTKT